MLRAVKGWANSVLAGVPALTSLFGGPGQLASATSWAAAVGAVLVTGGNLLSILFDAAWFAVLGGFAVFQLVVLALGLSMWHRSTAPDPELVRADVR